MTTFFVALGAVGSVASVIGLYALYDSRRSRRIKLLCYEWTSPMPLASAAPVERDYKLSIHYTAPGSDTEEVIDAAFVSYLRFANFGKEPIRRADIAPASPLRVIVENERVLDISLSSQRRNVTQISMAKPVLEDERGEAAITFDFLDFQDGAILRVLTAGPRARLSLAGDIIGMPAGIRRSDETSTTNVWGALGFFFWICGELAAFALAAWVVETVTGSWANIWLLALTPIAFLLPIAITVLLADRWPSHRQRFPKELALPGWLNMPLRSIGVGHGEVGGPLEVQHAYYWPPELGDLTAQEPSSSGHEGPG